MFKTEFKLIKTISNNKGTMKSSNIFLHKLKQIGKSFIAKFKRVKPQTPYTRPLPKVPIEVIFSSAVTPVGKFDKWLYVGGLKNDEEDIYMSPAEIIEENTIPRINNKEHVNKMTYMNTEKTVNNNSDYNRWFDDEMTSPLLTPQLPAIDTATYINTEETANDDAGDCSQPDDENVYEEIEISPSPCTFQLPAIHGVAKRILQSAEALPPIYKSTASVSITDVLPTKVCTTQSVEKLNTPQDSTPNITYKSTAYIAVPKPKPAISKEFVSRLDNVLSFNKKPSHYVSMCTCVPSELVSE